MSPEDRNTQIEFIHNVYKETHGVRPRHIDFDSLSDTELDEMADIVAEDSRAMSDDDMFDVDGVDDVDPDCDDYEDDDAFGEYDDYPEPAIRS